MIPGESPVAQKGPPNPKQPLLVHSNRVAGARQKIEDEASGAVGSFVPDRPRVDIQEKTKCPSSGSDGRLTSCDWPSGGGNGESSTRTRPC